MSLSCRGTMETDMWHYGDRRQWVSEWLSVTAFLEQRTGDRLGSMETESGSVVITLINHRKLSNLLALCEGNPMVNSGFPSQRASNKQIISMQLCCHVNSMETGWDPWRQDPVHCYLSDKWLNWELCCGWPSHHSVTGHTRVSNRVGTIYLTRGEPG